jgi:hypothetical protein
MDVGVNAVARMAREDTRWFVVGVVTLSIVLFLALPVSMLVVIDYMKLRSEMKYEIRQTKQLNSELRREIKDVANSRGNRSEPNQQRDAQSSRPSD